jgi:voltage-gated potassium channel
VGYNYKKMSFFDAIWFCVAVVTTFEFGDVVVTNAVDRIVAIILALYGKLVIAIITGVIVYYISKILDVNKLSEKDIGKISARIKDNDQ